MKRPSSNPYAPFLGSPPRVPFNRSAPQGREIEYVMEAIGAGHPAGDGPFGRRCEALLEDAMGARRALMTGSATHALEMAALLLDVGPGDEVVMPTFTFVSTANAFVLRGAKPVFADVRADTLNLDAEHADALCTPRTRAIVPVHYGGVACDLGALEGIALRRGLAIVEDNAQGHFARLGERALGTFGVLSALSFHESKNFSCGEGGALIVNDPALVRRAEILREKGTNRTEFHRGTADRYEWLDLGSSYLMSEFQAAFLLGQLEARDRIAAARRGIWERYRAALADWASRRDVTLPMIPEGMTPSYHLFHVLLPDARLQTPFIQYLAERGIVAPFHYLPLHRSPMAARLGAGGVRCPVAESASARLVRLPLYNDLSEADQAYVIDAVTSWAP